MEHEGEEEGVVVRSYANVEEAEEAVHALLDKGFGEDEISVVAHHPETLTAVERSTGADVAKGTGLGAAVGGILGGIAGVFAGATALAIPGVGVIIAGPLAAALGAAAAGAVSGGIVGALTGLGVSHETAEYYQSRLDEGDILVVVDTRARLREAEDILKAS